MEIFYGRNMEARNRDEALLLQIFPLEIWLAVSHYTPPSVIQSACCGSSAFVTFVHPIRQKHLFPKILPLLLPYLPKDSTVSHGSKLLLECRKVCRFWEIGVNQLFQDPKHHVCIEGGYSVSKVLNLSRLKISISVKAQSYPPLKTPLQFENHFQTSHLANRRNPFVSRRLAIEIPYKNAGGDEYCQQLEQRLTQCGHHVWYLMLLTHDYFSEINPAAIRTLLQLVPNMKSLYFCIDTINAPEPERLEPFPTYHSLEYLSGYDNPAQLFEAFLENNRHVKVLQVKYTQYRNGTVIFAENMPNLEQLEIRLGSSEDPQTLQNARLFRSLKTLVLNLFCAKWEVMGSVLQVLNQKFAHSLKDLMLCLPSEKFNITNVDSLYLPQLKSLYLLVGHPVPLDFILPMKDNLECLRVQLYIGKQMDFQELSIGFFREEFADDLTKSNIWQVFPKLMEIKFEQLFKSTTYKKSGTVPYVHFKDY